MADSIETHSGGGRHVLIVEDDPVLAGAIARNLVARGVETEVAGTADTAIGSVEARFPGVLLLDIDLPDGLGWDVGRRLRRVAPEVPIVVMSGLRPNDRMVHEIGCAGFLEKPFPMESLLRQIDLCLAGSDEVNDSPAPRSEG